MAATPIQARGHAPARRRSRLHLRSVEEALREILAMAAASCKTAAPRVRQKSRSISAAAKKRRK